MSKTKHQVEKMDLRRSWQLLLITQKLGVLCHFKLLINLGKDSQCSARLRWLWLCWLVTLYQAYYPHSKYQCYLHWVGAKLGNDLWDQSQAFTKINCWDWSQIMNYIFIGTIHMNFCVEWSHTMVKKNHLWDWFQAFVKIYYWDWSQMMKYWYTVETDPK